MKVSALLASGFISATLGLGGCGGGGSDTALDSREPIALDAKPSQAEQDRVAMTAERYNAEREKALVAAGVRPAAGTERPALPNKPGDEVAKKPGEADSAKRGAAEKKPTAPTIEPEYVSLQKNCKSEEAVSGTGPSDFCKSLTTIMAPAARPPSIDELQHLQTQCNSPVIAPEAAEKCKRNADLLQMMTPG